MSKQADSQKQPPRRGGAARKNLWQGPTRLRRRVNLPARDPVTLPPAIERRLRALSRHHLAVAWRGGFLKLIIVIAVIVLVQTGADWLFDLPRGTRLFLLAVDALVLVAFAYAGFAHPWLRRISVRDAAVHAELQYPELRTALISAVDLAHRSEGARSMVARLLRDVAARTEQLDFRSVVRQDHLRRLWLVAFGSILLPGGLAWWLWPESGTLLRRLAGADEPLPTQTIVEAISEHLTIQPGQSVDLAARAIGVIPRAGRVEIAYAGQPTQSVPMNAAPATPDHFALTIDNVQRGLTYRFFLNDGRGAEFRVEVVEGPVLAEIAFEQIYPAYTGLEPTLHTAGNLSLLAGSRLRLSGRSDQPLGSARMVLRGESESAVTLKVGADGQGVSGELPVALGLEGFSISLKNIGGVTSREDAFYRTEVRPDEPPKIEWAPDQSGDATLLAKSAPRLQFSVRDDFQIATVTLVCELVTAAEAEEAADAELVKRRPLDLPASGAAALDFDFVLEDPSALVPWADGTTINYWIEATDTNNVTGPGVGRSPVLQWTVVSVEEKRRELKEKLSRNAESIEDLSRTQEELRRSVGNILK